MKKCDRDKFAKQRNENFKALIVFRSSKVWILNDFCLTTQNVLLVMQILVTRVFSLFKKLWILFKIKTDQKKLFS